MKTINDECFGELTYDYQWERHTDITLWGRSYSVVLTVESNTDNDDSVSKAQQDAFRHFTAKHIELENEMMQRLIHHCQTEFGVTNCNEKKFLTHNTPKSIFFPLAGGWAILFDSDFDKESGLSAVVRGDRVEVGSQEIIL